MELVEGVTAGDVLRMLEDVDGIDPANQRYFEDNYAELEEEYAGQQVVVVDEEAYGLDPDADTGEMREFFDRLEDRHGEEAVSHAYIWYVPKPGENLTLERGVSL